MLTCVCKEMLHLLGAVERIQTVPSLCTLSVFVHLLSSCVSFLTLLATLPSLFFLREETLPTHLLFLLATSYPFFDRVASHSFYNFLCVLSHHTNSQNKARAMRNSVWTRSSSVLIPSLIPLLALFSPLQVSVVFLFFCPTFDVGSGRPAHCWPRWLILCFSGHIHGWGVGQIKKAAEDWARRDNKVGFFLFVARAECFFCEGERRRLGSDICLLFQQNLPVHRRPKIVYYLFP